MLNSISRTFVKTLKETKVLARDLSDHSGISEQTISVIKRGHQKSANVETVDSLLAALPVQDQINFIIEVSAGRKLY
jgi:DNA-binding Xre family transcriptional regulator